MSSDGDMGTNDWQDNSRPEEEAEAAHIGTETSSYRTELYHR